MGDTSKYIWLEGKKYLEVSDKPTFKSPFGKRWTKMALHFMSEVLAVDQSIHLADIRVLLKIVGTMGIGECKGRRVFVNQSGIAKDLNMDPSNVSRSIRKLIQRGYLERGDGLDKRYYNLNAQMAWYGSDNESHQKAMKKSPYLQ